LLAVVPLAVIAIGVFVAYSFGALSFVDAWFQPALVDSKGVVYWNGEILRGGMLETKHEKSGVRGANSTIGADGTVVLETMVNGEFRPGAYVGKHKVAVRQNDRTVTMVFSQPPPSSPEKYLDFKTSDLEINVTRDPAKNEFRLDLTGTGPKGQNNSKEETEAAAAAAAAKAAEPKQTPEELAKKILADNDQDKDGKLSDSERGQIPFQY
jgi:hypothetical protein